jgi:hypothetical protein
MTTDELNPDCCGELVCEGCGENNVLDSTGIEHDDTAGPSGFCMNCKEQMRYVEREGGDIDGNIIEGRCSRV